MTSPVRESSSPPLTREVQANAATDAAKTPDRIELVAGIVRQNPANPPASTPTRTWTQWAGQWAGTIVRPFVTGVATASFSGVSTYVEHLNALKAQISDPQECEAVSNLAKGLVPFLQNTLIPEGFYKSAINQNSQTLVFFGELLLYHTLVTLNQGRTEKNLLEGALLTIIETIDAYATKNPEILEKSLKNFKEAKTEQDRKAAYELLEHEFAPLVDELMVKAGLTEEGIKKITPIYQKEIRESCKKFLSKQCIDLYDKMLYTPGQRRKIEIKNQELLKIATSITSSAKGPIVDACHSKSALVVSTCNAAFLQKALSPENEALFTNRLHKASRSDGPVAQKLQGLIEEPLTTIVYNALAELVQESPENTTEPTKALESYVKALLSKVSLNRDLVEKILAYHEKATLCTEAEAELDTMKKEAALKPLPLDAAFKKTLKDKEEQVTLLQKTINPDDERTLLEAFRPLVTKVLSDIGYKKAKDLPVPELVQETVFAQLHEKILPKLLLDTAAKHLYELHKTNRLDPKQNVQAPILVAEMGHEMIKAKALPKFQAYLDECKSRAKSDAERTTITHISQGLSHYVIESLDAGCYKTLLQHNEENAAFFAEVITYHLLVNLKSEQQAESLLSGACTTLVVAIEDFAKLDHPQLQARYKAYKQVSTPDEMKSTHDALAKEFQPLVDTLLQKAGLDKNGINALTGLALEDENNEKLEKLCRGWLEKQCIDVYDTMLANNSSASGQENTNDSVDLENTDALLTLAKTLGASVRPTLVTACHANSASIAQTLNSKMFEGALTVTDEIVLTKSLQEVFSPGSTATKALDRLIEEPLTTNLYNILLSIAKKSPSCAQSAPQRLETYMTELLKNLPRNPELLEQITEYYERMAPVKECEKELRELQEAAVIAPSDELQLKIAQKKQQITRLKHKFPFEERHAALLQIFAPQVERILSDAGYNDKTTLPLPTLVQEKAYLELKGSVLPNLLLEAYAKVLNTTKELTRESREREIHVKNLKKRFGNDDLVQTARPFAQMLVKILESLAHLEADTVAETSVEKAAALLMDKSTEHRALGRLILANKETLSDWVKQTGLNGVNFSQEKFGKQFEDELEAFIIHTLDTVTENIEKLEQEDPKRTFLFVVNLLQSLTQHLEVVNRTTKQQKQKHMYMVDPITMRREFEKAGILDPAMTGSELIVTLDNLDRKITALSEQIERKEGDINEAKRRLEESLMSREALMKLSQQKGFDNFYSDFMKYILSLSGITSPSDLPGPPEMKDATFALLHSNAGASVVAEVFATAFEPMMLDKFLRIALESINEELKSPNGNEPINHKLSDEDRLMVETLKKLLAEARHALPGTLLLGTLHQIDELQKLPADVLAHGIRKTFHNYTMNKLLEYVLKKGAKATQEILDEPLPKTPAEQEEVQKRKLVRNERDIKNYHREAGETVYNGAEKIKNIVVGKWNTFQAWLDKKVPEIFGKVGRTIKRILDPVCRVLVIDCVVRPLFAIFNLGMTIFYWIYSKMVIHHAEHFRKCVTDTDIHVNFGYQALRLMQRHYPVG